MFWSHRYLSLITNQTNDSVESSPGVKRCHVTLYRFNHGVYQSLKAFISQTKQCLFDKKVEEQTKSLLIAICFYLQVFCDSDRQQNL